MSSVVASFNVDSRNIDMEIQQGNPSNFVINYKVPIQLPTGRNYEIALARGNLFYSWWNFDAGEALTPTIFNWNGVFYDIPSGTYSILTLEAKIKEVLALNGQNPDDFNMRKDYPSGRIEICITGGSTFTAIRPDFCRMIGSDVGQIWMNLCNYCPFLPDFEMIHSSLFINIDNTEGQRAFLNKDNIQYVYSVKPPETPAYSQFNIVDTLGELIYFPLSSTEIFEFRIKLINQDNRVVPLNGTDVKYWFIVRERLPSNQVEVTNLRNASMSIPNN